MSRNYNKSNNKSFSRDNKKTSSGSNSWMSTLGTVYGANANRVSASANIPFAAVAGLNQKVLWKSNAWDEILPSIMIIDVTMTTGFSDNNSSPLNIAARNLFSQMRKYNTSTNTYDPVDLMQYVLAMDSAYALYSHLCRIYGLLHQVSWANRFMPKALIESLGFDYDNLAVLSSEFNAVINKFGDRLTALPVADAFSFLKYHFSLFSEIYKDAEDEKAQLYAMKPHCFYRYIEGTPGTEAGKLKPVTFEGTGRRGLITLEDIDSFCDSLLLPLIGSGSISDISGDMLKLLSKYKMFALPSLSLDYTISPIYSEEFLTHLHNSKIVSVVDAHGLEPFNGKALSTYDDATQTYWIEQTADVGGILCTPYIMGPSIGGTIIIDLDKADPTSEDLMKYTRHMSVAPYEETKLCTLKYTYIDPETAQTSEKYCQTYIGPMKYAGLDYFCGMHIYYYDPTTDECKEADVPAVPGVATSNKLVSDLVVDEYIVPDVYGIPAAGILSVINWLSKFSVYPIITAFDRDSAWTDFNFRGILNDLTNYSFQDSSILRELTQTCLDSAFSLSNIQYK